jgi:hypothetical protein
MLVVTEKFSYILNFKMNTRKKFFISSNLLGLNFSFLAVPIIWVAFVQSFFIGFGFYFCFFRRIGFDFSKFSIYKVIDKVQVEVLFFLQIIFSIRAFMKKTVTRNILSGIRSVNEEANLRFEKKFVISILILIVVRILKIVSVDSFEGIVYMSSMTFCELTFASCDFFVEFLTFKMKLDMQSFREKLTIVKSTSEVKKIISEIVEHLSLKRKITQRYSFELLSTILYNYAQLIISFYYIFMRLQFNRMTRINGEF